MINIVSKAVQLITKMESGADQKRYFRALRYALEGDGKTPPSIHSPGKIVEMTRIPIQTLYNYWIVLDRPRAIELLKCLNSEPRHEAFRKRLSEENCRKILKRKSERLRNSFVFTHQEILKIEGLEGHTLTYENDGDV